MNESEVAQKIVALTVQTIELAEQVLIERQKRDGNEFSNEKPSILEVVTVSNLIVNMSMAGMYKEKEADDWIPSPAAFDAFIKRIEPIVDSKVSVAVARDKLMAVKARIEKGT